MRGRGGARAGRPAAAGAARRAAGVPRDPKAATGRRRPAAAGARSRTGWTRRVDEPWEMDRRALASWRRESG
eukprot:scaffold450_cov96-Isochrysis_galbana.AAC.1